MIRFFIPRKIPKPSFVRLLLSILFVVVWVIAFNYQELEVVKLRQFVSSFRTVNSNKLTYSLRPIDKNSSFSRAEIDNKAYSGRMVHLDSNGTKLYEVKFFKGYKYGEETHYYSDGSISKVLHYPERFIKPYGFRAYFNYGEITATKFSKKTRANTLKVTYNRNEVVQSFTYRGLQNSTIYGSWNDEDGQYNLVVRGFNNKVIHLYYDRRTDSFKYRNHELSGSDIDIIAFPSENILPVEKSGLQSKVSNWELLWKLLESDHEQRISFTNYIVHDDSNPPNGELLLELAKRQGTLIKEENGFAAYNVSGKVYVYKDGVLIKVGDELITENIAN
jgi:hypothetical protein